MRRAKFRTKNKFAGRRKNPKSKRSFGKKDEEQIEAPDARLGPKMVPQSATGKKFEAFGMTLENLSEPLNRKENTDEVPDCYFFVQLSWLQDLIGKLACPNCESVGLTFQLVLESFQGFSSKGKVRCPACENDIDVGYTCNRVDGSKSSRAPFDINMRATMAFRGIGCGYTAMNEWCGTMNLPNCLSQNSYTSNHSKLQNAGKETFSIIVDETRQAIKEAYKEIGVIPDEDGILNIGVSYDGSWQRRGHSSHNGMAAVIDLMTGLPIDYEVLSNFCLKCKIADEKDDSEELDEWRAKHKQNCLKNFNGSANAMELECALRLWGRSVEDHKMRYTAMLCDGDSKSFDAIVEKKVYGDNVEIVKEDCVNHVSKRMGTALRNLVAGSKAQGQSISGKGKLTAAKMLKIQNYYGRAIKDYAHDVDLLKKRIFAILFHMSSSDENPKHHHCPPGITSWCFWQRATAKSEDPGSHKEHETLPSDIGKMLVPIFRRLADDGLLKRCSSNKTQNPNESLQNNVWKLCPKTIFSGRKTVETAVSLAACQFSMGASFKSTLCKVLNMEAGSFMEEASRKKDLKRLSKAEKAHSLAAKKRRRELKFKSSVQEQKTKDSEGVTYCAGTFN